MNRRCLANAVLATAIFSAPGARAGDVVLDLNGFRLQQFVHVCEQELGTPIQTRTTAEYDMQAYGLDGDAYMVVAHDHRHPNNIALLQLTGTASAAPPFKGLKLGDEEAKVLAALGEPTSRIAAGDMPDVTRLAYEGRNYSVEIDGNGRLYSIQIVSTREVVDTTDNSSSLWRDFTGTLRSRDFASIVAMLRPDVEIYKDGRTLAIQRRYADFVAHPDSEFVAALVGEHGSVLEAVARAEPVEELRITEKLGVGRVFKFPASSALQEIAFFPYDGKDRVFEIAFRAPSD